MKFLPTPSARRATRGLSFFGDSNSISTHALREEGDQARGHAVGKFFISTHALREEGDCSSKRPAVFLDAFLPTPSARRATGTVTYTDPAEGISTHALREEGDAHGGIRRHRHDNFYPRPPRGGRPAAGLHRPAFVEFLPTPSARRATDAERVVWQFDLISTHALREEGDRVKRPIVIVRFYFYPRPPRGGRPVRSATQI